MRSIFSQILEAKNRWLFQNEANLQIQIEQTVQLGFHRSDVNFALRWINDRITDENLKIWLKKQERSSSSKKQKALFFHAGNLPLVGFQDVIAVLLSGVNYHGKLSRKDPFLMAGFLESFKEVSKNHQIQFSTEISQFENLKADKLIFSGSEQGSKEVLELAIKNGMIKNDADLLLRTAHFSIAQIRKTRSESMADLVESVLRYDGEGCRSVKCIVAPFGLVSLDCDLVDQVNLWQLQNQREEVELSESAKYYLAYYKAIEKPNAVWLNKIIVEHTPTRFEKDVVYWIKGDENTVSELKKTHGKRIQSVYSDDPKSKEEDLFYAQNPQLDWAPDGIDVLGWLMK